MSCLSDQRYNFLKANHNHTSDPTLRTEVVYQIKDTIFWKQITTGVHTGYGKNMLFIRSKIQFFESKSQLPTDRSKSAGCCLSDQRYNFLKANHNTPGSVVFLFLLFIRSKIQFFESKSQLANPRTTRSSGCLSDQRYNFLKANHNCRLSCQTSLLVVYQIKDTIFWKQITTLTLHVRHQSRCLSDQRYNFLKANHNSNTWVLYLSRLFIRSKIQFFESKSQQLIIVSAFIRVVYQIKDTIFWKQITTGHKQLTNVYCCLSDQRYNFLKANHNSLLLLVYICQLFIRSKIQFFESKSQLMKTHWKAATSCLSDQRYNFLKANHNRVPLFVRNTALFIRSKIQFFESKSQPLTSFIYFSASCLSDQRYNFLKANHNQHPILADQFWLFIRSKIQFFESKSQQLRNG